MKLQQEVLCNTHFVQLERHSLLFRHYAFVDTKDYLADQLFIQEKVRVYFRQETHRTDNDYCVIFCKVRKRDETAFLTGCNCLGMRWQSSLLIDAKRGILQNT